MKRVLSCLGFWQLPFAQKALCTPWLWDILIPFPKLPFFVIHSNPKIRRNTPLIPEDFGSSSVRREAIVTTCVKLQCSLYQWYLIMDNFAPQESSTVSGDNFGYYNWGRRGLPPSSGQNPEMLLSILQCTRQPPLQRIIHPEMSTGPRLRRHSHFQSPKIEGSKTSTVKD